MHHRTATVSTVSWQQSIHHYHDYTENGSNTANHYHCCHHENHHPHRQSQTMVPNSHKTHPSSFSLTFSLTSSSSFETRIRVHVVELKEWSFDYAFRIPPHQADLTLLVVGVALNARCERVMTTTTPVHILVHILFHSIRLVRDISYMYWFHFPAAVGVVEW